jgi:ribosomal-protein-alanine N-acetyltransferase
MALPLVMPMTPDDLDEIMPLERQCFADPWTRRMYLSDLTQNEMATYLIIRQGDGETGRWGDGETRGRGDAETRRHGDTETRRWGDAEMQRREEGQAVEDEFAVSPNLRVPVSPVLAYGGLWLMVDEAHIATIASHPDWRGCGLGQWLLLALLDAAIARGAVCSTLEVRAGNLPAQRLYEKLGYETVGMRRRYYRDGEDGLIMTTPPLTDPAMQLRLASARDDALAKLRRCFETTK